MGIYNVDFSCCNLVRRVICAFSIYFTYQKKEEESFQIIIRERFFSCILFVYVSISSSNKLLFIKKESFQKLCGILDLKFSGIKAPKFKFYGWMCHWQITIHISLPLLFTCHTIAIVTATAAATAFTTTIDTNTIPSSSSSHCYHNYHH